MGCVHGGILSSVIKDALGQFFVALQRVPSAQQYLSFDVFYQEVVRFSQLLGLTSLDPQQIIYKNFIDSLLPIPLLEKIAPKSILDIGSGGGFPGLSLAVLLPNTEFFLCERNTKKAGFLLATASLMKLTNVHILAKDFEQIQGNFDLCTSRAFTKFEPKIVRKFLRLTSLCLAYKGLVQEAAIEKEVITNAGIPCCLQQAETYKFGLDFDRTFLWFGPAVALLHDQRVELGDCI
ncbi:MAG: 16S rRNA (guanine(527)-N(7))-methyltransferase RsmG [Spirochaetia bacterium]